MGQDICPLNVVARGTRFKHYVQEGGATLRASHGESFQVRMIDTGLVESRRFLTNYSGTPDQTNNPT